MKYLFFISYTIINMKKTLPFLMAGLLVFCLAGCNDSNNNPEVDVDENEVVETNVDENEIEAPEVEEGLVYGAEWEWEFVVDTPIAKFTVPAGMKYEVDSAYISDDQTTATIDLKLQPLEVYQFWSIRITNQGMVDSYEKAVEHTIALQNLDSYANWATADLLDEVEYAGIKYQTIKVSTEWGTDYFLAGYKWGWEIVLTMPEKEGGFAIDSEEVKSLMESISVVDLQ